MVIIGNGDTKISQVKKHLCNHFQTKDFGYLKYFLGIEATQSKKGIVASQKNDVDILKETSVIDCRPMDGPLNPNQKLKAEYNESFSDPERY